MSDEWLMTSDKWQVTSDEWREIVFYFFSNKIKKYFIYTQNFLIFATWIELNIIENEKTHLNRRSNPHSYCLHR